MSNNSINQFFSLTEKLADAGNLTEAQIQLDKLITDQDLVKARAYNDLGVIAYRQGEKDKALTHYQKAVKLAPTELTYRKNLADLCYFEFGDAQTALEHYRQIIVEKPDDFEAIFAIGRICADLSKHFCAEANDFFTLAEKIRPGDEFVAIERKRIGNAAHSTKQQTDDPPSSDPKEVIDSTTAYAKLSEKFQSIEAAETEKLIRSFLKQYPNFALAHNDLGVISHQLENFKQSGQCYKEAVRLEPDNDTFRKNLADFLFVIANDPEAAMEHYHAVLKNNPTDIESLMMIGNICLALDSADEARNFFNLVLEFEPWHSDATQSLKMLDEEDKKPDENK